LRKTLLLPLDELLAVTLEFLCVRSRAPRAGALLALQRANHRVLLSE
jgi:hypothetical protein